MPLNHLNSARHRAPLATQVARPPRRVSLQRIWRSLALPLTALPLLGAGLAAEPASAGEYSVELCHTTAGHNAPIDPRFSNAEDYYGWGTSCGQSGGTTNLQMGELGRGTGAFVRAELPMPSGVRLVGGSIRRRVLMADPGAGLRDFSASPVWTAYTRSEGGDRVIETCAWFECRTIGWPDSSWRDFAVPSASALLWDLSCGGNAGGGCAASPGWNRAVAEISALRLRLKDDSPPAAGVTLTGPAADTNRTHKGRETVSANLRDAGAGIYQAFARIDGVQVGSTTVGGACSDQGNRTDTDLDFEQLAPCPSAVDLTVNVDTTAVADGTRELVLVVRDAAGNVTPAGKTNITIDNVPPPKSTAAPLITFAGPLSDLRPGDTIATSDGAWIGSTLQFAYQWQRSGEAGWSDVLGAKGARYPVGVDDIDHQLRVIVRATNSEGAAAATSNVTGAVRSGAIVKPQASTNTASNGTGIPQIVIDREQRSVKVSRGAKIVVTGRLLDADSRPIADADVDVFEQVSVLGSPWLKIANVKTDSQGGYVYRPSTAASRTLRFSFEARRGDGDYRATRDVVISVRAGMRIRAVKPVINPGEVVQLRGRVMLDQLPAAGTWIEVQFLDHKVWRTIGTRRTSDAGRWRYHRRIQRTSHATFVFRARMRGAVDVPAVESKSKPVRVRVR